MLSDPDLAAGELVAIESIPRGRRGRRARRGRRRRRPGRELDRGASVNVTLDLLAFESDLLIQGEIVWPISLSLLAPARTRSRTFAPSSRFRPATAQCRDLASTADSPKAEGRRRRNSTAGAAEQVARSRAQGMAPGPIGAQLAGELYGLEALALRHNHHPATPFLARARGVPALTALRQHDPRRRDQRPQPARIACVDPAGVAARSINLTRARVEADEGGARPSYCFVIDCEGHVTTPSPAMCSATGRPSRRGEIPRFLTLLRASTEAGKARRLPAWEAWREAVRSEPVGPRSARTKVQDGRGAEEPRAPRAGSLRTPRT